MPPHRAGRCRVHGPAIGGRRRVDHTNGAAVGRHLTTGDGGSGYVRIVIELNDRAVSVLEEGRLAHLAVASTAGPHVTPELYAWSGGRLWFASAAGTVKAKVVGRDPSVAAVVSVPGRSVVLAGTVETFDAVDVVGLAQQACELPAVAQALLGYGVRNVPDLVAFGRDAVQGRLGWRPLPRRVLFGLTPDRALVLENEVATGAWGAWTSSIPTDGSADLDADGTRETVPVGGRAAVLALPGPVAIPARWFAEDDLVFVAPALRPLVPSGTNPIGIVVDDYTAPGPAAKRGSLVRGTARKIRNRPGSFAVTTERTSDWDGVQTVTVVA